MSEAEDVIARIEGRLGRLTLNRPRALNALNTPMCRAMDAALRAWREDRRVEAVMIDHAGPRGFCAGGDIRMVAESGAGDGALAAAFFSAEYTLNALIHAYPKPYVAMMDGVTMGGGVGVSIHGPYRVATERTLWAMPETGIGLFPDVGGGWFLPRLPGRLGVFLGLTGARLGAADCFAARIATHVVASESIEALKARLIAPEGGALPDVLAAFHSDPGAASLAPHRAAIDRSFAADRAEDIFSALAGEDGEWAREQLALLKSKSPQTIKIALRQMQHGARAGSFAEHMKMEYRIALRVVGLPDFKEGVRAELIDRDNAPRWSPPSIEAVTDEMVEAVFAPLQPDQELRL